MRQLWLLLRQLRRQRILRTDCSPPINGGVGGGDSMGVCLHCHTVQPLTVGGMIAEVAPSFSTEYGRLCPQCMSDDLRIWDGHTCPKCGGKMQQEGKEEFWT